jgi:hypothetical protein
MAQQALAAAQGNGERLAAVPPSMFTGDRSKSKKFVQELNMYFGLNTGNKLVDNPMKKTLLALSHIRGELVDNWVDVTISCTDYFLSPSFSLSLPLCSLSAYHWTAPPTYLLTCSPLTLFTYCLLCCAHISSPFSSPLPTL